MAGFSLKDQLFNRQKVEYLAMLFFVRDPMFAERRFVASVMKELPSLELKHRITLIAATLEEHLSSDFPAAAEQIVGSLPPPLDESKTDDDFGDFIIAPLGEYVVRNGMNQEHLKQSLSTLKEITKRFSMEDAVRAFIRRFPKETICELTRWTKDSNYHVRRLVSDQLRRYALARSFFKPTTLKLAIAKLGFVQADPLRAPARAQDLILRHRVNGYRAGDLERHYPKLPIEEDFFVNYGFLGKQHHALMHPRSPSTQWSKSRCEQADAILAFVRELGEVHPREVDAQFAHGKVRNWFGGSSNASTQLLEGMHYRGLLRVARRDGGTRVYAAREPWPEHGETDSCIARMDSLVDLIVAAYAPLPSPSLRQLVNALRTAAPQWTDDRKRAFVHATSRLGHAEVQGIDWYWPIEENPASRRWQVDEKTLRLLAPFDPVVWDRRRFEVLWGWSYRFEAYTPAAKRKMGHYALPMLWGEQMIGWCNLTMRDAHLVADPGFIAKRPSGTMFRPAFDEELQRMSDFLGL